MMFASRIGCVTCCGQKDDGESITITATQDNQQYPTALLDTTNLVQVAQVVEVDADGDFRLLNEHGIESGFMFRREFAYLVKEAEDDASNLSPKSAGSPNSRKEKEPRATSRPRSEDRVARDLFEVRLTGDSSAKLGLVLDSSTDAFEILAVEGGPALAYNQKASPSERMRFGDFVVGVNGISKDPAAMLKELEKPDISLSVAPRIRFTVDLTRQSGEDIGMECTFRENESSTLLVQKVNWRGIVPKYNSSASGGQKIAQGDRITEVNGIRSSPKEMLDILCTATDKLEIIVGRPMAQV